MSERKQTETAPLEELLNLIRQVRAKYPSLRLGQLIMNVVDPRQACSDVYYITDDELKTKLMEYPQSWQAQEVEPPK